VVASEIGKGSTAQVLVTKIANVLRGVAKFKNHQVVVMLDELGTGTQQDAGLKLGQDVLKKLHKDGFSVYFSTQILELAHWVEDNLGGKCFKMGKNHTIEPGIANGAMNDLREKSGLNMLLQ